MRCPAALLLLLSLAACGSAPADDRGAAQSDTAVATALARPIMIDARMQGDANRDALSPPEHPIQAIVPPGDDDAGSPGPSATLVARAAARAARSDGAFAGCDWQIGYSYGWAARLAADMPLPNDARTLEAAGNDRAPCSLRIVRFTTGAAPDRALARYRDLAKRGGFVPRDLAGDANGLVAVRARDRAAFMIVAEARPAGSAVELLANRGI